MAVEVVGRYGWRKATAAAISVGESSVHFSGGCHSLIDRRNKWQCKLEVSKSNMLSLPPSCRVAQRQLRFMIE